MQMRALIVLLPTRRELPLHLRRSRIERVKVPVITQEIDDASNYRRRRNFPSLGLKSPLLGARNSIDGIDLPIGSAHIHHPIDHSRR